MHYPVRNQGGWWGEKTPELKQEGSLVFCQVKGEIRLDWSRGTLSGGPVSRIWGHFSKECIGERWPLPSGNAAPQCGGSGISSANLVESPPRLMSARTQGTRDFKKEHGTSILRSWRAPSFRVRAIVRVFEGPRYYYSPGIILPPGFFVWKQQKQQQSTCWLTSGVLERFPCL